MRLAWAFLKRDAAIAMSYRVSFVMQFVGMLLLLGLFYYIGRTIGPQRLPALERYGGSFMEFVLVGIALTDCVVVSLVSFAAQIRDAQMTGTLEATLMSPVRITTILIFSSLWNYCLSAFRFLVYIILGVLLFGADMGHVNVFSAVPIFLLTILSFMGIGILWAGIILLIKRGESTMTVAGYIVLLLAGVLYPVDLLPAWLRALSVAVPLTHALEGMRLALLHGSGLRELAPVLLTLCGFAAVLMTAGISGFALAVRAAKQSGSLTQF